MSSRFHQFIIQDSDSDSAVNVQPTQNTTSISFNAMDNSHSAVSGGLPAVREVPVSRSVSATSKHSQQSQPVVPPAATAAPAPAPPTPFHEIGSVASQPSRVDADVPATVPSAPPAEDTPRDTNGVLPPSETDKKKGTRKKKVVRRRKPHTGSNNASEYEDVEVTATATATATEATSVRSRRMLPSEAGAPPPPRRVSPRAMRTAESRQATPRASSGPGIQPAPQIPLRATNNVPTPRTNNTKTESIQFASKKSTPRDLVSGTPRSAQVGGTPRSAQVGGTPRSVRESIHSDPEAATPRSAPEDETLHSSRIAGSHKSVQSAPVEEENVKISITNASRTASSLNIPAPKLTSGPQYKLEDSFDFKGSTGASHTPVVDRNDRASPSRPRPTIPPASALEDLPTPMSMDSYGNLVPHHRAAVKQTIAPDGRMTWVYIGAHHGDDPASMREVDAPPKKLSQRAQDIMAAKRAAVEKSAKRRHSNATKIISNSKNRRHLSVTFAPDRFYNKDVFASHQASARRCNHSAWLSHRYDTNKAVQRVLQHLVREEHGDLNMRAEQIVRTLQPIQVVPRTDVEGCLCVHHEEHRSQDLHHLLSSSEALEDGFKRFLNLQPMQLANIEVQDMAAGQNESPTNRPTAGEESSTVPGTSKNNPQRGVATLGGLWCTVEAIREDGRPLNNKEAPPVRRVMRVCGGQALGLPLREEGGNLLDVRSYELILFSQEQTSPSAVNYGSEGLTLGQMISPPASSFPLTPRLVDDPVALKEYKRKVLTSKSRDVILENNEDDRITFTGHETNKYLTITLVTLNSRQKNTIDLTLVMLPYRQSKADGGKILAEVPSFSPLSVSSNRRLQGVSLSFPTNTAFMSAYKALLWATECNIVDIEQPTEEPTKYVTLRVTATPSPLLAWSSSLGEVPAGLAKSDTFHGQCVDFAVLSIAPESQGGMEKEEHDPLKLEDFIIQADATGTDKESNTGSDALDAKLRAANRRRRCSAIYNSTLPPLSARENENADVFEYNFNADNTSTVVGLTPFGQIRRAVSQKTSEVFDVRVVPRNKARVAPAFSVEASADRSAKDEEEFILQQDVEAAIVLEYVSRLPFQSRIYGVLVDEHRYYVFQEPWISALALEESTTGTAERDALDYNVMLKRLSARTSVMSLKDFIHAALRLRSGENEEARLQIAQVLASQLLLLLTSIHGKGILLGPCPPQRILVRIEQPEDPKEEEEEEEGADTDTKAKSKPPITSRNIQIFVPDIGVNALSWSYERQQCGVLEYLPPQYIFEHMLGENVGRESRPWTMRDDWWTYLCICFELFSGDGSALVKPAINSYVPTATPVISKFNSPVDVLNVWKDVLIGDSGIGEAENVQSTINDRVRTFVQKRVLESIAPQLESWITRKGDELELFGTTAKRQKLARAVPQQGSDRRMIGISLSAAYLQKSKSNGASVASLGNSMQSEGASVTFGAGGEEENALKEISWIFYYRELFDSIVDQTFNPRGESVCDVHTPTALLLSHPFFATITLPDVFDGTYVLPAPATALFRRQYTKKKLKAALLAYRTGVYRAPVVRPEYPLMITNSAFNSGGVSAPLLLLASPSFRDEANADQPMLLGYREEYDPESPEDGLVYSPSHTPQHNVNETSGVPSSRARSPSSIALTQQNRLRQMYKPEELQNLAALETEVRGFLQIHQRDGSARPTATDGTYGSPQGNANPDAYENVSGSVRTPTHDEQPYDQSHPSMSMYSNKGPAQAYTTPKRGGNSLGASQRSGGPVAHTYNSPPIERNAPATVPVGVTNSASVPRSTLNSQSRRSHTDYGEIEETLNNMVGGPKSGRSLHDSYGGASGTPDEQFNRRKTTPRADQWPAQFLDEASLEKKGQPNHSLDASEERRLTIDHFPEARRNENVISASEPRFDSNAASGAPVVLEEDEWRRHDAEMQPPSSTYQSSVNGRGRQAGTPRGTPGGNTPRGRTPKGKNTPRRKESAVERDSYFSF